MTVRNVAHEEGNLNDLRAILGNEVAIKAYREGNRPFPDGTIGSPGVTSRWLLTWDLEDVS